MAKVIKKPVENLVEKEVVKPAVKESKPVVKGPKLYYAVEAFHDRVSGHFYPVGSLYQETTPERTEALLKAEKSELNRVGRQLIQEGK